MKYFYTLVLCVFSLASLAIAPTTPASNPSLNAVDGAFVNLGWTAGNGARRIIICKAGSPVSFVPQNGVDYTENTAFGSGQMVAPGEYVVYDHFSTSFFLTALSPATQYFYRIYEYNGTGAAIEYLTSAFLAGNFSTSATPATQTSNANFTTITTNSVTLNWQNGSGLRRLIVVREGSPVNADPVNNQPYTVNASFGSGATTGPGNFTVYNSSSTGTSVTNLKPGTEYFFAFYEFNGSNQPQYKTPAYTTSVTTRSMPTVPCTNLVITKTDGKELSLGWTNGNGQRRIIIAKQGSNIVSTPVNGTDYTANAVFGTGQQLSAGEFVVYDDNFNAATISGLNPATVYFFRIFEYDGTGTNTMYLTSSFASVNGATAAVPAVQSSNISVTNLAAASLQLQLTAGDGRARLIIGRKNAAVNATPVNFTVYTANSDFGNGQDLGNGNFVLGNSTDAFLSVHNLEASTSYHFAVFEFNGHNQPLYLLSAATFSATTLATLPVKLTRWEAVPASNKVKLQWTSSSEINVSHYIIERSADGTHFSTLTTVQAAGNSQSDIHYAHDDMDPLPGRSYYRLKMTDADGKWEYSSIRVVILSAASQVSIIGNPVRHQLELVTSAVVTENKNEWVIINIAGQPLRRGTVASGRTAINVSGLPAGSYWIRTTINNEIKTMAFVKQ